MKQFFKHLGVLLQVALILLWVWGGVSLVAWGLQPLSDYDASIYYKLVFLHIGIPAVGYYSYRFVAVQPSNFGE